jgi:hypothetical protein
VTGPCAEAARGDTAIVTAAALRCWTWRDRHACGCGIPGDCLLTGPPRVPPGIPDWGAYDAEGLGLVPHDRYACPQCRAVGA